MSYFVIVPLLPLLGVVITAIGPRASQQRRAEIGVWPLIAAFFGTVAILVQVAAHGPTVVRFYEPGSAASLAFPIGFYFDRLSAVMMALISAIGIFISTYSGRYMQQERGYSRFLSLIVHCA